MKSYSNDVITKDMIDAVDEKQQRQLDIQQKQITAISKMTKSAKTAIIHLSILGVLNLGLVIYAIVRTL